MKITTLIFIIILLSGCSDAKNEKAGIEEKNTQTNKNVTKEENTQTNKNASKEINTNKEKNAPEEKNTLKEMNLKGKVKSIRIFYYSAVNKNGEIIKGQRKNKTPLESSCDITFNDMGNATKIIGYKSDGGIKLKVTREYDSRGKLIEENMYNSDGSHNVKIIKHYDKEGVPTEENIYDSKGNLGNILINRTDNKGKLTERNLYNTRGDLNNKWKYRDGGKTIEEISYKLDGSPVMRVISKKDKSGNLIEQNVYNSDNKLYSEIILEYDNKGNLIEQNLSNQKGKSENKWTYQYKRFIQNNWGESIQSENGLPKFVVEREIKYASSAF